MDPINLLDLFPIVYAGLYFDKFCVFLPYAVAI